VRSILCLSLLLPLSVLAAQREGQPLPARMDLVIGQELVVVLPRVVKIAIGDSKIADVKPRGDDKIALIGVSEGETTLRVWQWGEKEPADIKLHVVKAKAPAEEAITLKFGEQKVLEIASVARIAVGDPEIAHVKVEGNKLVVTAGNQTAATNMIVWTGETRRSFLINVVP
jgi:Flp pilus assembly secretin CpaC